MTPPLTPEHGPAGQPGRGPRLPGLPGLLGRWVTVESWAAAGKLGVARRTGPAPGPSRPSGPPRGAPVGVGRRQWEEGTGHEAAGALDISVTAAGNLIGLAVALQARCRPEVYGG